jgi:hypothetical protein
LLPEQVSSAADDPFAVALRLRPAQGTGVSAQQNVTWLPALQLSLDVGWPLSLLIPQAGTSGLTLPK